MNGETDSSMADDADIARIQYVIDNYDTMELLEDKSKEYRDKNQKPAPMVKISKRVNGTYYVVEAVPDTNKHELAVVTAYKKKATEQQTRDAISPHSDVRNASTDVAFSNNISQETGVVNKTESIPDTLEKAAMDVVAERIGIEKADVGSQVPNSNNITPQLTSGTPLVSSSASGNTISQNDNGVNGYYMQDGENNLPLAQRLEAQSRNNEPIAVEDVQKATGLGEHGSKLIAELASSDGVTFNQAERAVKTAYMAGFSNVEGTKANFVTDTQMDAFYAGKKDRVMQDLSAKESAKNATVYEGTLNSDLKSDANNGIINTNSEDAENNASSDIITKVSNAIESSLRPEIKSNPELMNMLRERFGGDGITALARDIVLTYGDNGGLGEHEALFADGGETIYEALGSALDGHTNGNITERLNGEDNGGQYKNFDNNGRWSKFKSDSGAAETLPGTQGRPDDRRGTGEIRGRNDGVYQREIRVNGERVTFDVIPKEDITGAVKRSIDFAAVRNVDAHLVRNIVAYGNIRASGFNINDKEIYYNGNEQTFGHEMGHLIKRKNPAAFEKLTREIVDSIDTAVLRNMIKDYAMSYRAAYGEDNIAAAFEELACDICGNIYADLEMLKGKVFITDLKGAVNQYFDSILPSSNSDGALQAKAIGDVAAERFDVARYAKSSDAGGLKFSFNDSQESNSIKEQLKQSRERLEKMSVIASINSNKEFKNAKEAYEWALQTLKQSGYKAERVGFGTVVFDEKRIKNGLQYLKTKSEYIAYALIPKVIKRGIVVGEHLNHKSRGYDTITFAAPVEINGTRGSMAIVVRIEGKNYYKLHRVLMPDGGLFEYKKGSYAETAAATTNVVDTPTVIASTNSISQTEEKSQEISSDIKFSLSGENSEFWDEWLNLAKQYGTIPAGENPARDVSVPKKTSDGRRVSQTVRTILEAKVTPDEAVPSIEELVTKGEFSYDAYTDKEAIAEAEETIAKKSWEAAKSDWYKSVGRGDVSKKNTAEGWVIYNNAVNRGETETALEVLGFMVKHQRSAAQALQATRILKKLSPETQLYGVQKSVNALQEELKDRYGKKAPDLEIDTELAEKFLNAKTEDERGENIKIAVIFCSA